MDSSLVEGCSRAAGGVVSGSSAVTVTASRRGVTALTAGARLCGRKTLNDAVASKHATIHREVAANHEGSHGSILLGQPIWFVGEIRLVLAAIDKNEASKATVIAVTLVHWVCPSTSSAKTLKVLHIESTHCDILTDCVLFEYQRSSEQHMQCDKNNTGQWVKRANGIVQYKEVWIERSWKRSKMLFCCLYCLFFCFDRARKRNVWARKSR